MPRRSPAGSADPTVRHRIGDSPPTYAAAGHVRRNRCAVADRPAPSRWVDRHWRRRSAHMDRCQACGAVDTVERSATFTSGRACRGPSGRRRRRPDRPATTGERPKSRARHRHHPAVGVAADPRSGPGPPTPPSPRLHHHVPDGFSSSADCPCPAAPEHRTRRNWSLLASFRGSRRG